MARKTGYKPRHLPQGAAYCVYCGGSGCDRCGGKGYYIPDMEAPKYPIPTRKM